MAPSVGVEIGTYSNGGVNELLFDGSSLQTASDSGIHINGTVNGAGDGVHIHNIADITAGSGGLDITGIADTNGNGIFIDGGLLQADGGDILFNGTGGTDAGSGIRLGNYVPSVIWLNPTATRIGSNTTASITMVGSALNVGSNTYGIVNQATMETANTGFVHLTGSSSGSYITSGVWSNGNITTGNGDQAGLGSLYIKGVNSSPVGLIDNTGVTIVDGLLQAVGSVVIDGTGGAGDNLLDYTNISGVTIYSNDGIVAGTAGIRITGVSGGHGVHFAGGNLVQSDGGSIVITGMAMRLMMEY